MPVNGCSAMAMTVTVTSCATKAVAVDGKETVTLPIVRDVEVATRASVVFAFWNSLAGHLVALADREVVVGGAQHVGDRLVRAFDIEARAPLRANRATQRWPRSSSSLTLRNLD